ncbi:uncharacterized protein N7511_005902 [Penicillium nucicola]|uniref:uncharacterized protein n=1 Tax=Penicillium nucicola TaxID=1850975 RepID=UPI0025458917|nr:uncharacterized protein N7511_005902 [Penicillium nucicola]KAJ5762520.1 hypothetical protein N7511_005902 [Penicillium nucicola]
MTRKAKAIIALLLTLIAYVSINSIAHITKPAAFVWYAEDRDEQHWIASSRSWFDRKACRWLSVCGAAHLHLAKGSFGQRDPTGWTGSESDGWRSFWRGDAERRARQIPDFVFHYAPLVHLYSGEQFWPGDIAEHLHHTTPSLNYTPIDLNGAYPTLSNLDDLNQWEKGWPVYLTSQDDVQSRPPWLEGEGNIPEGGTRQESWSDWDGRVDGEIPGDTKEDRAQWYDFTQPGTIPTDDTPDQHQEAQRILKEELRKRYSGKEIRDEGAGVGAMPQQSCFNLGNTVANVRFGNHVGDWEHCLVRFHNGSPKSLFFSAHQGGEAYSYEAVEKIGQRPVIYSAEGSHAMYATAGVHEYILPWGLLHDVTDRGPLWDPLLNSHAYTYDFDEDNLRASTFSPSAPTEWFYFKGHWGDKFYHLGDPRQYRFAGQYHYVNGPTGPRFKHLNRHKVCQGPDHAPCIIKNYVEQGKRPQRWGSSGPGE